jgi:beta-phosphoglucomutase-like phosphatase (HAD superfamily)
MAKVEISLSPFKAAIFDMDGTMILNMEHHRIPPAAQHNPYRRRISEENIWQKE